MRCSSIGLLKIEPGHFPEGDLRCRPQTLGQEQGHEQVQVGGSGMKTMGHQPDCLRAAAAAALYTCPLFKCAILFCFFFLCAQGGVPKQVLFRPGLQVPAVHF